MGSDPVSTVVALGVVVLAEVEAVEVRLRLRPPLDPRRRRRGPAAAPAPVAAGPSASRELPALTRSGGEESS